jgi:serine protease Do
VNMAGALIGINTFIRSASGGNEGLAFAIPSDIVALALTSLRECGFLQRATLGFSVQSVTPGLRSGLGLRAPGLVVANVLEDGPAASGGIRVGDVITAIDGDRAHDGASLPELFKRVLALRADHPVVLSIDRAGQSEEIVITPVAVSTPCPSRPQPLDVDALLIDELGVLGVPISDADARAGRRTAGGVLVTGRVATESKGSPLMTGDILRTVNGVGVGSVEAVRARLASIHRDQVVVLQVDRGGRLTFVEYRRN